MRRIFTFAEWQENKIYTKNKCIIQVYQDCYPISSNPPCVAHYEKYVKDALDNELRPILGGNEDV